MITLQKAIKLINNSTFKIFDKHLRLRDSSEGAERKSNPLNLQVRTMKLKGFGLQSIGDVLLITITTLNIQLETSGKHSD
ncbi:MAG: hypothetical protein CMN98_04905 [Synechococcus sp. NP17]|nr:hypothetical protein [Synechococcus sp. NP17]